MFGSVLPGQLCWTTEGSSFAVFAREAGSQTWRWNMSCSVLYPSVPHTHIALLSTRKAVQVLLG